MQNICGCGCFFAFHSIAPSVFGITIALEHVILLKGGVPILKPFGAKMRVVSCKTGSPFLLAFLDCSATIGHHLAHKIRRWILMVLDGIGLVSVPGW